MSVGVMNTVFAYLTLLCIIFVTVTAALFAAGLMSEKTADVWESFRDLVDRIAMQLALVVALVALLGSMYYSEVADFPPCEFCWYQRIGIYPLSVILVVALVTVDRGVRKYIVPLTAITSLISIWHILLQRVPALSGTSSCTLGTPCTAILVERFGFITIPVMALMTSLTVGTLMLVLRSEEPET